MWGALTKDLITESWELQPLIFPMENIEVSAVNKGKVASLGDTSMITAQGKGQTVDSLATVFRFRVRGQATTGRTRDFIPKARGSHRRYTLVAEVQGTLLPPLPHTSSPQASQIILGKVAGGREGYLRH